VLAAPALPPPASSAVPESAIATVVVPAARPATSEAPPAGLGARPQPRPAGGKPAVAARVGTGATAAGATTSLPSPAQPPNERLHQQTDKPTPAVVAAPVLPSSPAPEPPKPTVATGPEAKCGTRSALSYFFCMERECLRSEFGTHADCLKWRKEAKRE
jgi:hypothetical protein